MVGRIYKVDVIDRDPEHTISFQELDDGLRVSLEPRQVTANTRWVSIKQSRDKPELPSAQSWMRDVSIGDIADFTNPHEGKSGRNHQQ